MNNTSKVREHLKTLGHITPGEALMVHKMVRLAPRIKDLRDQGMRIKTVTKLDGAGDPYTSYLYTGPGLEGTDIRFEEGAQVVGA